MLSEAKRALLTRFSRDGADCETLLVIQPFDGVRCAEGTVLVVAPGSIGVASSIIARALLVARPETQSLQAAHLEALLYIGVIMRTVNISWSILGYETPILVSEDCFN